MATPAAVLSIIVEANTGKAEAALKEFQRNLSKADREKAEAELAFQVEKGGYDVFSGLVKKADAMSASAELKFDADTGGLFKMKAAQAVLTKESSKLSDVFNRSQLSIGQWTAILTASLPVVFDLAGALGALTASLGAATAGLGALGAGGLGAAAVGIAGIASVAAPAISSLGDLKDAQDAYTEAVERYGKGSSQAETALTKLTFEQKKAGPLATELARGLRTLTRRWKELTKAGQTDFIGLMNDGVTRLNRKLPLLAESANSSMKALRVGFDRFLDRATGPEFDHFIHVMTVTFARSVEPLAGAFGNIAKVLERIAVAVAPDIVRMARGFERITEGWVDSTRNAKNLREVIHSLVGQTQAWWNLIKATGELVVAVLVPGMGQGQKAVEGITATLQEWTAWVKAHPKEMRDFFKQGLETTKQLVQTLLNLVPVLFQLSRAMRPLVRAFLVLLKALSSFKIGSVSALTVVLGALVAHKIISGVRALYGSFVALRTALFGAAAAETALGAATARTTTAMTAQQVMAGSSMFGGGLGGGVGKTAGGGFARAFGMAATAGLAGAAAVGIYGAFTSKGGIIDTIKGKGTDAGAGMAEEMSSEFAAKVAPKMKHALRQLNFGAMDQITEQTHRMIEAFDAAGIEVPDALRQMARAQDRQVENMKASFADWRSSLTELKHMIFRSMGDIKDKTRETLQDINKIQGLSNERRLEMTRKTYHNELVTIRKSLRLGLVEHREANREIENITRKILRAYGVKDVQRLIVSDRVLAGVANRVGKQRGGHIPGAGEGDKVPAMLEAGEFVVNKKATKAARPMLEDLNRRVPRFQEGGLVQRLAKGGLAAMTARADKFEQAQFPYVWGGGHGSFGIQPVDCSGAVSDVLHAAGLLDAPMVSGSLANWGKPGKGPLTVYANAVHTFMSLAGKYFGTSSSNPGGGAGWFSDPGAGYRAGFAARTMDVGGMGAKIKLPRYKATASAATGTAATLNTIAKAGELAIENAVSAGGMFGGGQALNDIKGALSKRQISSVWRMANRGQGKPGLMAAIALAESAGDPRAVGHDAGGTTGLGLWQITTGYNDDLIARYGGKTGMFNPLNNAQAAGDLLARQGLGAWVVYNEGTYRNFLKRGGMVPQIPYVGAFDKGGTVPQTGLGLLHKGEEVLSMQRGGMVGLDRTIKRLQRIIDPHPVHHARMRRRREREEREARRHQRREDEKARLARLQRETRQETRARHRREQAAERKARRRKERQTELAAAKEQIQVTKALIKDLREHNRLYRTVRMADKQALGALVDLTASQIGAKGLQKTRLAGWGVDRRY